MKKIRTPKTPCRKCLQNSETRQETEGYVLLYCPHNRAGLLTSLGEANGQMLDVVLSPLSEKEFKSTVVSVLLNNALRVNRRMDKIFDDYEVAGKLGSA